MQEKHPGLVATTGIWKGLHPAMGIASKGMIAAFVVFTALNVEFANSVYSAVRGWIESALNWYYISALTVMLFVCLYLMCSRHGKIKLGDDDSKPEFSNFSWFAMLFSAGVGIGLLFFGIAEPMFYFDNTQPWGYPNNPFADLALVHEMNETRAAYAMRVTYFHWGFHGWAVYVMIGLCLAYFGFRKKLPLTLRSALYPVIGDRIYGPVGHAVDLLAVFGTVFGVATSLGLGVSQMATGLNYLFEIDPGVTTQVILIAVISIVATFSAVSGVGNGIRIISEWNIWLSVVLLAYFLFGGPFQWLMGFFVTAVGDYLWNVIPMGFQTFNEPGASAWQGGWTIFYWGWWISWAPFVGMFIARISRGRTIREFMLGVMFVPTTIAFFWLCIFGGNAMYLELTADGGVGNGRHRPVGPGLEPVVRAVRDDRTDDGRQLAELGDGRARHLPARHLVHHLLGLGTLVITTMLSMGDDDPPQRFRIVWGIGEGFVAAALLLAGGLKALQTAAIAAALPVSVIMVLMTFGILKSLNEDSSVVASPGETEEPEPAR